MNTMDPADCLHPPTRQFGGVVENAFTGKVDWWVACCQCGGILKSVYPEDVPALVTPPKRKGRRRK